MQHSSETGIPAFLTKLWTLLEDPSTEELICWDPSGRSFHIYEQARFAKEVLPHYFKHSNIASFIRQLNMYGFRKVVNIEHGGLKVERDDMEFAHQHFIKGKGHLLEYIKRKVTNVKTPTDDVKLKSDDVHKVLSDVRGIKGKQEVMNDKLDSLKHENETLWREVATLRQKHMKQQQIVNKLIQFLVTMVGNRPVLTRKRPLMLNDASQLLQSSPPKAPKLDRTLSIEASDESSSYSVQSPPDSSRTTTHPHTLTIQEVTDNLESPTLGFPQVPAYETVAGLPTTGTPAQPEDINIMDTDHDMTAVNPLVVLENTTISAPAAQPEIVSLPTDSTGQQVFTLGGQQILTIPANASSNTGAGTGAVPVQVIVLPANTATAAGDNGSMTSTTTSGSANTGNDSGLVYVPNTASIANNNSNAVAVSTANLTSATDGRAQAEKTKTPPEPVVCCNPSTSSLKDDNSKALCCNKTDVVQHIEGLDMELDGLKDIMTGNYNFDTTLLSGLFNPEAPLPPTPEAYWNLEDKDSIVGNELMAYNPQSEDLSKLFDLDVPEESELEEVSDFDFDKHGSGLETPVFNPSTPMPSLSLASALASRRKSNQKTTTSTDEID